MAQKTKQTKAAAPKGGGSTQKKSAGRKPAVTAKTAPAKGKAVQAKPAVSKEKASEKVGSVTKAPNGSKAAKAPNGSKAVVVVEPEKIKKKPPSITITRPEATRPPVVLPPPRPVVAPIGAPYILLPKEGEPIPSLTPILRWMYVGGATRYEVEWSHDSHFGRGHGVTIVSIQTAISLDSAHELKPAMMYKWRVRGGNDAGWGPWSPPESFRSPEK